MTSAEFAELKGEIYRTLSAAGLTRTSPAIPVPIELGEEEDDDTEPDPVP